MKILRKVVMIMSMAILFGTLVGCTEKTTNLWVMANEIKFEVSYQAFDVTYDGIQRNFSVKDNDAFETQLRSNTAFIQEIEYADSSKKAMLFEVEQEMFIIFLIKDNQYGMRPAQCTLFTEDGQEIRVACPPLAKYNYSISDTIAITKGWDYFFDFYSKSYSATIMEGEKKIEFQTEQGNILIEIYDGKIEISLN